MGVITTGNEPKGLAGGRTMADHWMQDATKNMKKGALRKALHVKDGENIPESKLEKAEHSDNPTMRRRAALAETFKKAHHNHGGCAHCAPGQTFAHQVEEGHAHTSSNPV